jgi:hypothetical protein
VHNKRVESVHRYRTREVRSRNISNLAKSSCRALSLQTTFSAAEHAHLETCKGNLADAVLASRIDKRTNKWPTRGDIARCYPGRVHNKRHAAKHIAYKERCHIHAELRVEDVPLALELLQTTTVEQLMSSNVKHAQPDKTNGHEGKRSKSDDNLSNSPQLATNLAFKRKTHGKTSGSAILQ